MKTITILPNGDVQFIEGQLPFDLPLGKIRRRRVSVIEPNTFWKKKAFRVLRLVAGDTGRAAAFSRTWRGPWRVRILATGETAVFESRADAITWEVETLSGAHSDF